jgi:hypothetical protein
MCVELLAAPLVVNRWKMEHKDIEAVLHDFGSLDGAMVTGTGFNMGQSIKGRSASITLNAFLDGPAGTAGWRAVSITASGDARFSWKEAPWETNIVINYAVTVISHGGLIFIDFDPLHAKKRIEGLSLSEYYLGGRVVNVVPA